MLVLDFILHIINFNNVDDILKAEKTQSKKGQTYERLWDIFIKFGFCEKFPRNKYNHFCGNVNTGIITTLKCFDKFLKENLISGNSGGVSDITLQSIDTNKYIFISSKYPKSNEDITKQKSVKYYEIQNIIGVIDDNKKIYEKYNIYLLVPDKKSVLEKVKRANKGSHYITKYMKEENILDEKDLNKCFLKFKHDFSKNIAKFKKNIAKFKKNSKEINYNKFFNELYLSSKIKLELRFHQYMIVINTSSLIEEGNNSFLWGCKCRSGKTYMIGGLITNQLEIKKKLNVLIITPAPTETAPQFTDDLFNKFKDFEDFTIHHIEGSNMIEAIKLGNNNIFVMSKQLLQNYIVDNTNDNTIKIIKNLKLDIIAFDENHFSGTSDISTSILKSYSSKNTVKIYLTATYNKPLHKWAIPDECQMFWDIEDEQICKSILDDETNLQKLKEKHNDEVVSRTIKDFETRGDSINDMFSIYENMPDLYLLTSMFDKQRYDIIKEKIMGSKYGFCFDVLLALNKQKTKFQYESEVKTILRYISGSNKEVDFKNGDKSIFTRVNNICSNKESRTSFTQIWFLPSNNINQISVCLKKLMEEDSILNKYKIMCINRNNTDLAKDVKGDICKQEKIAMKDDKQGLILLAGNMLTLGITLNKCDLVLLMNNAISSDKVLQQMYRCMTEGENKKFGFVVDLNISRVLNTCINYSTYKNEKNTEEKMKYLINNHLINIDVDMMEQKQINSDDIVSKLMDIWKSDPINSFISLIRNLDNDYIEFDNSLQKKINETFISSVNDDKVNTSIELKDSDDELQELPSGKEKINTNKDKSDKKKEKIIQISFSKDVLPYIIPLVCILTMNNSNTDFIQMLNNIQENAELLNIFDDMCLTWWNKKELLNLIKEIISKNINKNSNTYNIAITFKMNLNDLIDNPKKLLELINECLKPKKVEKRKYGEVYTPMIFINDKMLHDLEIYYKNKYNKNIFEDETLKWGDTSAGMGNYPIAIYYKLMDGLKKKFPNKKHRKKHIIENMLYMAELNKKNCYVIKQIFNFNNEYKLNLYEGDSLQLDIQKEFGITKFNIIIGNPPYNEESNKRGELPPIYNKFIEYYIEKCDLLYFIIPSRWFSGGKGLDSFRKNMLIRTDIVYIKHFDDACKIFGNSVEIKGGVNYFLKDVNYNDSCKFNGITTKLNKYDIFVDGKFHNIIDKIIKFPSIKNIFKGRYFNIETNSKDLDMNNKNIKCYVSKLKGLIKYINKNNIKQQYNYWKLITPTGSYKAYSGFGDLYILNKNEVHTTSYVQFKINTKEEADNLLSYMKTKLPNFMLSLRKNSQLISASTCKWIPLPPLNRKWTDEKIYKYFKLSDEDIKLIEDTNIIGYNSNNKNVENKGVNNTILKSEIQSSSNNINFTKMKKEELKEYCKLNNIKGYSKKNKDSLIKLITDSKK